MATTVRHIGSYLVERLLGVGSFATVWLGYDPSLDARVAIKVLAENWSHDARVRERFLDEARLLWRLDDDRIVRVHALGELPDGRPYLVMDWAGGGSLHDRLARGPMTAAYALGVLREICAGVQVLHDHGIVHRDLTPGNVLFTSAPERVIIADLGLAKALAVASGLTCRAGTPGYMAPEQQDPLSVVDRRADVYGLGRLGMRLLAAPGGRAGAPRHLPAEPARLPDEGPHRPAEPARLPDEGPHRPAEPARLPDEGPHRRDGPARLRDGVPRGVADVLRRATAQHPGERYPDAAAFGAALDRAVRGPSRRRRPAAAAVLAAASVVMLGATVSDSVTGRFVTGPGVAVDASGRLAVTLPPGWRARTGPWDPAAAGRHGGTAVEMSPDPARRRTDPAVPGAFVGLSRAAAGTPSAFLARRRHAGCAAMPVRARRLAGVDWLIAEFRSCPGGPAVIVEAAGAPAGSPGLVHLQLVPGADGSPAVDALLAGVRVR